jgi:hypothetical protein
MGSIINVVRFQNKLRALFGIRGENPIPTTDELRAYVCLEDDRPEFGFAGLEFLGIFTRTQAAVVGQNSYVAIVNPPGSAVLVVVESCVAVPDSNIKSQVVTATAAPFLAGEVASGSPQARDLRIPGGNVFAARFSNGSNAASPFTGPIGLYFNRLIDPTKFVIPPGFAVIWEGAAQNAAVSAGVVFRERAQERGLPS